MFFRLALGNVRKSLRDYAVYFVTLSLGVAVFYAFNTISDQAAFLSEDTRSMVQAIALIMRFVTVFLALVLGFLMVYANNYLVRRRKRELGLYQLLGMMRSQVSLVLVLETFLASVASFVVGLAAGVLLSQLLVFMTAALFNDTVTNFAFTFSSMAALFTLGCFVAVFLTMLVFNLRTLRKVRLVELMGAARTNERMRARSLPVTLAGVMLGVGLIGWAYARLLRDGLPIESPDQYNGFFLTTAIVFVGTVVFFLSLSGVLFHVARAFRGGYYRGLNMFTVRQLSSRVNTVSVSMGVVSLILFLAITSVSGGLGICAGLSGEVARRAPYDASIELYQRSHGGQDGRDAGLRHQDAETFLGSHGVDLASFSRQVVMVSRYDGADVEGGGALTLGALSDASGALVQGRQVPGTYQDDSLYLVAASEYNAARRACGLGEVQLGDGGYLLACGTASGEALGDFLDDVMSAGTPLRLGGRTLVPVASSVDSSAAVTLRNSDYSYGFCVVPDDVVASVTPSSICVNLNYSVPVEEGDRRFEDVREALGVEPEGVGAVFYSTRTEIEKSSRGTTAIISYLAIYIGFVLVIACAAILAIQQLSAASDAAPSYRLLFELGCPSGMAMGSLFAQVLAFFLLPLLVALAHSAVALSQVMKVVAMLGKASWLVPVLVTAIAFVTVYGSYLMVTYLMARGIVGQRRLGSRG